jgi:hypothetical protein
MHQKHPPAKSAVAVVACADGAEAAGAGGAFGVADRAVDATIATRATAIHVAKLERLPECMGLLPNLAESGPIETAITLVSYARLIEV